MAASRNAAYCFGGWGIIYFPASGTKAQLERHRGAWLMVVLYLWF